MDETGKLIFVTENIIKIFAMITRIIIVWIVCHYISLSIKYLSGTTTNANFILRFIMEQDTAEKLSYFSNFVLAFFWFLERKSRKKLIKSKSKEIKELTFEIDKNRGTSNLTQEGYTNEKDK